MKKFIVMLLAVVLACGVFSVSASATAEDVTITVTPNVSTATVSDEKVTVVYTVEVTVANDFEMTAFEFEIEAPEGVTLATTEEYTQGAEDCYWLNYDGLLCDRYNPGNIFEQFNYSTINQKVYAASGSLSRFLKNETKTVMTISAEIEAGKEGDIALGIKNIVIVDSNNASSSNVAVNSAAVTVAHEHTYAETLVSAATCTAPAKCIMQCSVDGCEATNGEAYDKGSALGHSYTNYVTNNDAECEKDGTKTAVCDNGCGEKNTVTDEGSALGHKYTNYVTNNDAECEKDGTKTAVCDNGCGEKDIVTDEGSALEHKYTTYVSDGNAKCEQDGTKTAVCDNGCGKTDTVTDEGSALKHKYTTYVSDGNAACEKDGTKTAVCDNGCGKTDTVTDVGSALEHKYTTYVSDGNAKCEQDGTKTAVCDNGCGKTDTVTDEGSALGHKYTDYKSNNDATCTEDGTETASCDNGCGNKDTRTDEGSALGHKYTDYKSNNDAICTEDGTETASCDNGCGNKDTRTDEGSALGHTYETVTFSWTETAGNYTATYTASCYRGNCDHKTSGNAEVNATESTAKNCQEIGKTTFVASVTLGGKEFTEEKVVEGAVGPHDFKDVVTKPTCTDGGYTTRTCEVEGCDYETTINKTDALGHDYENKIVASKTATGHSYACENEGCDVESEEEAHAGGTATCAKKAVCTACGQEYGEKDASNHSALKGVDEKPATCTETGTEAYWHCDGCDLYYADAEAKEPISQPVTIEKIAHTGSTATCAKKAVCTACGQEYGEKDASNHSALKGVDEKPATCTETGTEAYWHCGGCDLYYADAEAKEPISQPVTIEIDPEAHRFTDKYVSDKSDDCEHYIVCDNGCGAEKEGSREDCTFDDYSYDDDCHWAICGVCRQEDGSEPVKHTMGEWETQEAATATEDGWAYRECTVCEYGEEKILPATGTSSDNGSNGSGSGSETKAPPTGDDATIALWAVLFVMAGAGVVVLSLKKKEN